MSERYIVIEIADNQIGLREGTDDWLDAVRMLYRQRGDGHWIINAETCEIWDIYDDDVIQTISDFQWYMDS